MKRVISILLSLLQLLSVQAQFTVDWTEIDWVTMPSASAQLISSKSEPCKFADVNMAGFDLHNSGTFEELANGTTQWQIGIRTDWATNIMAFLTNVKLSQGDQLMVQSPSGDFCQLYEPTDISQNGTLLTTPIKGDSLVITLSSKCIDKAQLSIESVGVGFRNMPEHTQQSNKTLKAGYDQSESCEISATCVDGFDTLKQSVCRLVIYGSDGAYWGTGVLVNNTSNDGTPYLLTAAHCLAGTFKYCLAQFNFESPLCQYIEPKLSATEQMRASTLLVRNDKRDLLLLCFDQKPQESTMAYYAGWNASSVDVLPSGTAHCIHHPSGDVRMISEAKEVTPKMSYTIDKTNDKESFDKQNHWEVKGWNYGATESGSSGSPLFDDNGRVIGCLTGGLSTCTRPSRSDYFWMIANNWDELSPYLDPQNTGQMLIDGGYFANNQMYTTLYACSSDTDIESEYIGESQGYVAGHNSYGTTKLAQRFDTDYSEILLHGIYLTPMRAMSVNGGSFDVTIWQATADGVGQEVYTQTVSNSKIAAHSMSYIPFTNSVSVGSSFYAGIEISYADEKIDSIALYYQANGSGALFYDGEWRKANYYLSSISDVALFVSVKGVGKVLGTAIENISSDTLNYNANSEITIKKVAESDWLIVGNGLKNIHIYDVLGRKIKTIENICSDEYMLRLNDESYGMYVVWIVATDEDKKYKILKR